MSKRDKAILADLVRFRALTRDQLIKMHFQGLKNPVANANSVMLRLYRQGLVSRSTFYRQFVYFPIDGIKKDSTKLRHFLAIADVYLEMRNLGSLRKFDVEPKYGKGLAEPDAFAIWKGSPFFIEVQRTVYSDKQIKDKVKRYEQLERSGILEKETWQPEKPVMPAVIVLTDKRYAIDSKIVRFVQVSELGELVREEKPRQVGKKLKLA